MTYREWHAYVKQHNACPIVQDGWMRCQFCGEKGCSWCWHSGQMPRMVFEIYCLDCHHHFYESGHCPRCAMQQPTAYVDSAFDPERDLPLPDALPIETEYRQVMHLYDHPRPVSELPVIPKEPDLRRELRDERRVVAVNSAAD